MKIKNGKRNARSHKKVVKNNSMKSEILKFFKMKSLGCRLEQTKVLRFSLSHQSEETDENVATNQCGKQFQFQRKKSNSSIDHMTANITELPNKTIDEVEKGKRYNQNNSIGLYSTFRKFSESVLAKHKISFRRLNSLKEENEGQRMVSERFHRHRLEKIYQMATRKRSASIILLRFTINHRMFDSKDSATSSSTLGNKKTRSRLKELLRNQKIRRLVFWLIVGCLTLLTINDVVTLVRFKWCRNSYNLVFSDN